MGYKSAKSFIPPMPYIEPPSEETTKKIQGMSKNEIRQFKKSEDFKKCVQSARNRRKKAKRLARAQWWKSNWINIATLIVAIITLIVTIIFGLQ